MQPYFTRLVLPPAVYQAPLDWNGCWKIYTICTKKDKNTSTTIDDIRSLEEKDKKSALLSYISLLNKAHMGQNFKDMYDEKKCHLAHSFKIGDELYKIFRIWGAGVIRIYFIYMPNRVILILKTCTKRKNILSNGETERLEIMVEQIVRCLLTDDFNMRVI